MKVKMGIITILLLMLFPSVLLASVEEVKQKVASDQLSEVQHVAEHLAIAEHHENTEHLVPKDDLTHGEHVPVGTHLSHPTHEEEHGEHQTHAEHQSHGEDHGNAHHGAHHGGSYKIQMAGYISLGLIMAVLIAIPIGVYVEGVRHPEKHHH